MIRKTLQFWLFVLGTKALGILSARWANGLGRLGGWLLYLFSPKKRKLVARHSHRVLAPNSKPQVRGMFTAYGRYWAEALWVKPSRGEEMLGRVSTHGIGHVVACQSRGQGMIGALPHVGNWEVAGLVSRELGLPLMAVAEDLPNPKLTEWFVRMRSELNIEVRLTGRGTALLREMEEWLQTGGMVALLSDRDLTRKGVEVDFFGERTSVPSGPALLSIRTGCPILPIASYFKPKMGHRIIVRPPLWAEEEGERKQRIAELSQRMATELEWLIHQAPVQWHMFQPNWPSDWAVISNHPSQDQPSSEREPRPERISVRANGQQQ